jgi:hypothetical protein
MGGGRGGESEGGGVRRSGKIDETGAEYRK